MSMFRCICGQPIEGADGDELYAHLRAHADEAHPEFDFSDADIRQVIADYGRMAPWDGTPRRLGGEPRIRALGRDPEAFLAFFDREAFAENPMWASCYCMFPHLALADDAWGARTGEQNRADKIALIRRGEAHGYLAFDGDRMIGWCHAAPRETLPGIASRSAFRIEHDAARVGSIACFVVAAPYRRQGVARRLLDAACDGLREAGMAFAEGYPRREAESDAREHFGPLAMYLAAGFRVHQEGERNFIVRKQL